jgi:hypothetical protein
LSQIEITLASGSEPHPARLQSSAFDSLNRRDLRIRPESTNDPVCRNRDASRGWGGGPFIPNEFFDEGPLNITSAAFFLDERGAALRATHNEIQRLCVGQKPRGIDQVYRLSMDKAIPAPWL